MSRTTVDFLKATDGAEAPNGGDIPGVQPNSASGSANFGTWQQASTTRPVLITATATVETDGTNDGHIQLDVDESGSQVSDYTLSVKVDSDHSASAQQDQTFTFILPEEAQYKFTNNSDPNSNNAVSPIREWTL